MTVGTTGQLELLSTAIMDGWMAGLGAALPPTTDALGQLLAEYSKRVYTSQMQHLKVFCFMFSVCFKEIVYQIEVQVSYRLIGLILGYRGYIGNGRSRRHSTSV